MGENDYTINELSHESGISRRTIYYYITLGLLPSVGTRGTSSRYDEQYLERLKLIKLLQANHLPLEEIRDLFSKLSNSQISRLASSSEFDMGMLIKEDDPKQALRSAKEEMIASDAQEYIQKVLEISKTVTNTPSPSLPPQAPPQGPWSQRLGKN